MVFKDESMPLHYDLEHREVKIDDLISILQEVIEDLKLENDTNKESPSLTPQPDAPSGKKDDEVDGCSCDVPRESGYKYGALEMIHTPLNKKQTPNIV